MSFVSLLRNMRLTISSLSRRGLGYVVLCWIVTTLIAFSLRSPRWSGNPFAYTINVVNLIAIILAISAPLFLGVGLLFSTPHARKHLLTMTESTGSSRMAFSITTLTALLVNSIGVTIIIIGLYLSELFHFCDIVVLTYLPAVLASALAVSSILTLLSIPIALSVDDWRMNTVLGSIMTIALSFLGVSNAISYVSSASRDLAIWSPHYLVRALTLILSGYEFESEYRLVRYLGYTFTIPEIVVPLLVYFLIAVVLLFLSLRHIDLNLSRWRVVIEMILVGEDKWNELDDSSVLASRTSETDERKHHLSVLKKQRQLTVAIVILLVFSSSMGGIVLGSQRTAGTRVTLYESPGGSSIIPLGQWFAVEVLVPAPTAPLENVINWGADILDWGDSPDTVRIQYLFSKVSLNEFWAMNETEKSNLVDSDHNRSISDWNSINGYEALGENSGQYVCAFRVSDPEGNSTARIRFFLEILRRVE